MAKDTNQAQQVMDTFKNTIGNGTLTLKELYDLTATEGWATKTPEATIRRIVQNGQFDKIKPGLWAIKH